MELWLNNLPNYGKPLEDEARSILGKTAPDQVLRYLKVCPAYIPTPLHSLTDFATDHGLGAVYIKDEGHRLHLSSFKALGAAYALMREVQCEASKKLGRDVQPSELLEPEIKEISKDLVFGSATDGNHGRSLAAGAKLLGAQAHIFVHKEVSKARISVMEGFGATVNVVQGNYDDSVAEALKVCNENGWQVLSDTSWEGYRRIPYNVMQGYSVIIHEALEQMSEVPTHIFLQAGVGGLAGSIAAYLQDRFGADRPKVIVVEPESAACCLESARAGKIVQIDGDTSVMGMLECFEPSQIAWPILERCADYFVAIPDEQAISAMRQLAYRTPRIVAGESGVSGFAALVCSIEQAWIKKMGIDQNSRILLINSEGATDPELYERYTGCRP